LDWREHPRLALAGFVVVAALLVVLGRGCGCGHTNAPVPSKTTEAAPAGAAKKVWTDDCAEPTNWGHEAQTPKSAAVSKPPAALPTAAPSTPVAQGGDNGVSPVSKAKKPVRPKDIADWKRDDYYSAKRDKDPRLEAAVAQLGKRFVGSEHAAELLTKLLEESSSDPVVATMDDGEGPRQAATATATLTQTIIAALVANGMPPARKTLASLVVGTFKTANAQAASTAAVEAILLHPSPENEELLFRCVTLQREPSTNDRAAGNAERLRQTATAKIVAMASEGLRTRLANYMIGPDAPQSAYDQLWTCLKEPRAENLPAQIILYGNNATDQAARKTLEAEFMGLGSAAVRSFLGVRARKARDTSVLEGIVAKEPYRVASRLWNADFVATVEQRLRAIESLETGGNVSLLAATLPIPTVRATLARSLEKHWDEGPRRLESLGLSDGVAAEPGFLAIVKTLPRKDAPVSAGNASAGSGGGSAVAIARREAKMRADQTAQQWMEFSKRVVQALCERLNDGARAEQKGPVDNEERSFPLKLPPRSDITAVRRVTWPDDFGDKMPAAPTLRVSYVRIEQKAQPTKVLAYFRRLLPTRKEHPIVDGLWLDTFTRDKEHGGVRSLDVLLTKAKTGSAVRKLPDQEQLVVVEILSVECDDMGETTIPQSITSSR
jgi:hypothetical protein